MADADGDRGGSPGEIGRRVRREVLGDAHVEERERLTTDVGRPWQEYLTSAVWGQIWSRPGIDRTTRRHVTIALLTALRAEGELELHLRAALAAGVDPDEIAEVILHTAAYAGVPAANSAMRLAERVIAERAEQAEHAERVDVVDADDTVVATVTRSEMRARRLRHRAVFVVVTTTDGRLLVHQRSATKDLWPGRWDLAVGGVVAAGETYDEAAVRELAEEVGITGVVPSPGRTGRYADADVDMLARSYHVVHDGPFDFADGEVVEARLVGPAELTELLRRQSFVPDSVALLGAELPFPFPSVDDTHGG